MSMFKTAAQVYNEQAEMRRIEQEIIMAKSMAAQTQASIFGGNSAIGASTANKIKQPERFNPNVHEAFQVPLSHLVTMWRIRYGDEWVDAEKSRDGSFYAHACNRLALNDMFEKINGWVRLKEGLA